MYVDWSIELGRMIPYWIFPGRAQEIAGKESREGLARMLDEVGS